MDRLQEEECECRGDSEGLKWSGVEKHGGAQNIGVRTVLTITSSVGCRHKQMALHKVICLTSFE